MMTAYGEVDVAVEAMKRGAFDFLSKPVNLEKLDLLIQRGLNEKNLKTENKDLHQRLDKKFSFDGILGKSPAFEKVLEQVKLVGPSKSYGSDYRRNRDGKRIGGASYSSK